MYFFWIELASVSEFFALSKCSIIVGFRASDQNLELIKVPPLDLIDIYIVAEKTARLDTASKLWNYESRMFKAQMHLILSRSRRTTSDGIWYYLIQEERCIKYFNTNTSLLWCYAGQLLKNTFRKFKNKVGCKINRKHDKFCVLFKNN